MHIVEESCTMNPGSIFSSESLMVPNVPLLYGATVRPLRYLGLKTQSLIGKTHLDISKIVSAPGTFTAFDPFEEFSPERSRVAVGKVYSDGVLRLLSQDMILGFQSGENTSSLDLALSQRIIQERTYGDAIDEMRKIIGAGDSKVEHDFQDLMLFQMQTYTEKLGEIDVLDKTVYQVGYSQNDAVLLLPRDRGSGGRKRKIGDIIGEFVGNITGGFLPQGVPVSIPVGGPKR